MDAVATLAIETTGLTKQYGERAAVADLNLAVPAGSAVGLLGPNGAGKSTTIKMLLGLVRPTRGMSSVFGIDSAKDGVAVRQRVGYVPERHHIYGWMTVGEVLRFVRPFYPSWNDNVAADLVRQYALEPSKPVNRLSHGMGTKLSLILALAHEPDLLILDEPTTGLDPLAREEFVDSVSGLLARFGKTVLFSSHNLGDVEKTADTIAIMYNGALLAVRSRTELLSTTKRIRATLQPADHPPDPPPGTILDRMEGNVWTLTVVDSSDDVLAKFQRQPGIQSIAVDDMTLEDIFKDYVRSRIAA